MNIHANTGDTTTPLKSFDLTGKRIWVAGHKGMVGSAIVRRLGHDGHTCLTADRETLDLRNQKDVETWIAYVKPQVIFLAAARVGGIAANVAQPADFLYDNLMIEANVIHAAHAHNVEKLVFLGSTCIYPKLAAQPIHEDALMTGPLEPTNEWYAIAKIAGLKLCQAYRRQHGNDFITAMPTNLYGPGDTYDLKTSHVLPALLRKAHEAKINRASAMTIWGSGTPLREFLYVDDLAEAVVFLAEHYSGDAPLNIGSDQELSIEALARMICKTVGFTGALNFDRSKPDGTPRKRTDSSKLTRLGWQPRWSLESGLRKTYEDLLSQTENTSKRPDKLSTSTGVFAR